MCGESLYFAMAAEIVSEIKAEYGLETKHRSNLLGFFSPSHSVFE